MFASTVADAEDLPRQLLLPPVMHLIDYLGQASVAAIIATILVSFRSPCRDNAILILHP